jgi:hypothetical protein
MVKCVPQQHCCAPQLKNKAVSAIEYIHYDTSTGNY